MGDTKFYELGKFIRKTRRERGLRLEDLADEHISPTTISNIERGVPHVSNEKVLYLANKLQIRLERIPELLLKEKDQVRILHQKMKAVDTLLSASKLSKAEQILNDLPMEADHLLSPQIHHLHAKFHLINQNYQPASDLYQKAIQLADEGTDLDNVKAACYLDWGYLHYTTNNMKEALETTDKGIQAFKHNGNNPHLWYSLHRNKALFLERSDRYMESMKIVSDLWDNLDKIEEIDTILTLYWLRAELSRQLGNIDEAINYAYQGIELAQRNEKYESQFNLWTVLGVIHLDQEKWDQAEFFLQVALELSDQLSLDNRSILIYTYSQLAIAYIQLGKKSESLTAAQKTIDWGERLQETSYLVEALVIMGGIQKVLNHLGASYGYYQKALELSRQHQWKRKEQQIIYKLSLFGNDQEIDWETFHHHFTKVQSMTELSDDEIFDELLDER
ncbi:helix-turn-helix domain-containing protein [Desmospora profundinema]|uniref:Tetratricopeptide (TPR) repeat protein n=1 Tax=Desmospora profundinema TaxID=1571184 RepID=A0ABU1ISG5_9BACL|nr:helix-turn-helix transcriptional regulator [Desmospora profundinema]MDR6226874.1 tetratricopeptide (TPR) repeat protein [Desmospora profundinema]